MRRLPLFLLLSVVLGLVSCQTPRRTVGNGPLILISIDGFRWDYLDKYEAPVLRELARTGVHARRMNASFPTKTFPNHYTLVTGLRPGRHGIVANWFHDPATAENFSMARTEAHWWSGGEPIWITAEKQGVRAACFFWPGSETELQGLRPTFFRPFDKTLKTEQRVDGLLAWLERPPAERPKLLTLYFDLVDDAGHAHGPESPETASAVRTADAAVGRLLEGLTRLGLRDSANLVIVSDHGMAGMGPDRVVFLDDLMDLSRVNVEAYGTYGGVRPKPGVDTAALVASIRTKTPPQVRVYRREELPARFHYNSGERIPPILLLTDPGWNLEPKSGWPARRANYPKGNHGWDPAVPEMGALFLAQGPAFRRHVSLASAENVDVYNLLCTILGLHPAANDGGDVLVRAALRR